MSSIANIVNKIQDPSHSFSSDLGTVFSSDPIPKEERIESGLRITAWPFLWINRAFNATDYIISLKPFAGLFLAFQQFYHIFNIPMKSIAGAVYSLLFVKNIYFIHLQNAFMTHIRGDYLNPLAKIDPSIPAFEQVEAIYESLKETARKREDRELVQRSWILIQECKSKNLKEEDCLRRIGQIRHNLVLDAWLYVKNYPNTLEHRVTTYCFEKIQGKMDQLIGELQSGNMTRVQEAEEEAIELLNEMDEEARKILIVHLVGTISLILTLIGFALFAVGCPAALPFFIYCFAYAFMSMEYVLFHGLNHHAGWDINWGDCIPSWIRNFFSPPAPAAISIA